MPQGVNIPVNMVVNNAGLAQQLLQTDKAAQQAAASIKAAMKAATQGPDQNLQNILNTLSKYQPAQIAPAFGPAMAQNLAIYQQRMAQAQKAAANGYQMPSYKGMPPSAPTTNGAPSYTQGMFSTMMMAGSGHFRTVGANMAQGFLAALTNTTGSSYGVGTRLLGAMGIGQAASSFGGTALSLATSPLGWGAAVIGAMFLGNAENAKTNQQGALLAASVGGLRGNGRSAANLAFAEAGANHYRYDGETGIQVAQTLGLMGVPAKGMFDPSGRGGTLGAVLAASRQSQLDPQTMAQFFGSQMSAGGQSLASTIKNFRTLEEQSKKTNIPLDRMIEEVQKFGSATGGLVPNMQALAGIQSVLGPGISAGGLIAPLSNATGSDAYKAAALLGIPVGKLQALQFGGANHQGNQAQLLDLLSAETKKITAGKPADQARTLAETFLNNTQLLDTSGLSAYKYSSLIDTMIHGSSKQFEKAAQGVGQGNKFSSTADWENQMLQNADNQTSAITDIEQNIQQIAKNFGNFMVQFGPFATAVEKDLGQIATILGNLYHFFAPDVPHPTNQNTDTPAGGPSTIYPSDPRYNKTGIPHPKNPMAYSTPEDLGNSGFMGSEYTPYNTFGSVPNFKGKTNQLPMWQWAMIQKAAKANGEDPFLLAAVVGQESSFDPFALNKKSGAAGLGQLTPGTAKWVAQQMGLKNPNLFDPQTNLNMRAWLDDYNFKKYGSWAAAEAHSGTGMAYGQQAVKIELQLDGNFTLKDAQGNTVSMADYTASAKHWPSTTPRPPVASRHPAPNPHTKGHHSQ